MLPLAVVLSIFESGSAPQPALTAESTTPAPPAYLRREVAAGQRHLDHGVLGVGAAGGWPHLYRLEVALGLLDHVTLGVTAHWLPGQAVPGWSPLASLAFWRSRWLEVGTTYRQVLHPPPRVDSDPETPAFPQRTHYVLGAVSFSRALATVGFDLGVARLRVADLARPDEEERYVWRTRLAGGVHLRIGTRRFGVSLQGMLPDLTAEAVLDVRFSLFERRARGGWLDY